MKSYRIDFWCQDAKISMGGNKGLILDLGKESTIYACKLDGRV